MLGFRSMADAMETGKTRHIFVTGGVASSLGKGLTASSLGNLLSARGLHVVMQKLDPYLNVDPGTMNPFQHGLDQVAAFANHHLNVQKTASATFAASDVQVLTGEARTAELARMFSGLVYSASAREHAQELLALARA